MQNNPHFQWGNTLEEKPIVDWTQLQYQNIYKSPEYVASKFSGDFSHLLGFDEIIKNISNKIRTPSQEMNDIINSVDFISTSIIDEERNNSNISEFKDCQ